ncbi:hypothetical protein [Bacillus thuringiensis]|uniref:hypothetical protein n=1 Tax=Bacillus thuringiensis TaxID=1428 RepID=UPI00159C1ED2|nr:hypothetical protein [Bacillus thuringiensis]
MATAPVITNISFVGNSFINVAFTSAGATNELLFLERSIVGKSSLEWETVRGVQRGTLSSLNDYTSAPADITYRYRFRATNPDRTGAVYSNTIDIIMVCQTYSSISVNPVAGSNDKLMEYATSRNSSRGRSTTIHKFAGRRDPVAEKAIQRSNSVDVSWICRTWIEVEQFMELMLDQDFWYRDNSGRSFHAVCSDIQVSDSQVLNQFTLSTTLTKISGGFES